MPRVTVASRGRVRIFGIIAVVSILVLVAGIAALGNAQISTSEGFLSAASTRTPGPTPTARVPPPTVRPMQGQSGRPTFVATRPPVLQATPLPTLPTAHRSGYWAENLSFAPPQRMGNSIADGRGTKWTPNGTKLAFSSPDGTKIIQNAQGWTPVTRIGLADGAGQSFTPIAEGFSPQISPDGTSIAYLAYIGTLDVLHVRVVNIQSKQVSEVAGISRGDEYPTLAWLSSSELAYYRAEPRVFDTRNSQSRSLLDAKLLAQLLRKQPMKFLTASPGKGLVAVGSKSEILVLQWTNSSPTFIRRIADGLDHDAWAISPDGQLLAYVAQSGQLKIISIRDARTDIVLPSLGPLSIAWSPDSASLVFTDSQGGEIVNRDGSGLRSVPGISVGSLHVAWSPDGRQLTYVRTNDQGDDELYTVAVSQR